MKIYIAVLSERALEVYASEKALVKRKTKYLIDLSRCFNISLQVSIINKNQIFQSQGLEMSNDGGCLPPYA